MHAHGELLTRFFEAMAARDAEAMGACYHDDAVFMDPVFGRLTAGEARAMWRMLLGRSRGLDLAFEVRHADEGSGSAHWEPRYTFSKTGRAVHNVIESQFGFHEGLILAHRDRFDLWRWSRQALGATGVLLGWSPLIQDRIRAEARRALDGFMSGDSRP